MRELPRLNIIDQQWKKEKMDSYYTFNSQSIRLHSLISNCHVTVFFNIYSFIRVYHPRPKLKKKWTLSHVTLWLIRLQILSRHISIVKFQFSNRSVSLENIYRTQHPLNEINLLSHITSVGINLLMISLEEVKCSMPFDDS